ncbi:MAG: ROK family protein [Chloroflexi bacterium]|nr:ROK family protein [Chloroflexota bacterium]
MAGPYIIAVDIGGTRFRVALADSEGTVIKRVSAATETKAGWQKSMDIINQVIRKLINETGWENIKGIGAAVAGVMDTKSGVLKISPNIPGWTNIPIKKAWENEFGISVYVCNDASLAALGEYKFGAGKNYQNFVYVTVSTGIGGGIILDGKLFTGTDGFAGEIGHMVVEPEGPLCGCGGRGCLEALASGTAIARLAGEQLRSGKKTILKQMTEGKIDEITAEMVARAAVLKDEVAIEIMQSAGSYLGIGLANLIMLLDPEAIIIGGGVAQAGELIFDPARRVVAQKVDNYFGKKVPLIPAGLGDDSGLMGAIAVVMNYE